MSLFEYENPVFLFILLLSCAQKKKKEELQNMVLLTRPQNMIDAYDSASYKEQTLESIKKVLKGSFKTIASTTSQFNRPTSNFNSKGGTQVTLF